MPRLATLFTMSCLLLSIACTAPVAADEKPKTQATFPKRSKLAWTYPEAFAALRTNPRDVYLQYVTLRLSPGKKETRQTVEFLQKKLGLEAGKGPNDRRDRVDLLSPFTSAASAQEVLQFDFLSAGVATKKRSSEEGTDPAGSAAEKEPTISLPLPPNVTPLPPSPVQRALRAKADQQKPAATTTAAPQPEVKLADISGPTVLSQDWKKLLAGRRPAVSELSRCVPADLFLIEFRSLSKLFETADLATLWMTHFSDQALNDATSEQLGQRLLHQLSFETSPRLNTLYDATVSEVAVVGSDLFVRDGSDVTVLIRFKPPSEFQSEVDKFLANARKEHPESRATSGTYRGVKYEQLANADRSISTISAYPRPGLLVRSNSLVAFQRIIDAIQGTSASGAAVARLGDSAEYQYVRTLLPLGAKEEDGFIYASETFLRKMLQPQVKLTGARRMRCYNHLKMIGHASTLYETHYGARPRSIAEIEAGYCAPGKFGEGRLKCPDGGTYQLSADGTTAVCSHHGTVHFLCPCCEHQAPTMVTAREAAIYKKFVEAYAKNGGGSINPIALRLQLTPERVRAETVFLPGKKVEKKSDALISIDLPEIGWGKPEPLDALPVPRSNICSVAVKIDKDNLVKYADKVACFFSEDESGEKKNATTKKDQKKTEKPANASFQKFLSDGIGNQLAIHFCDSVPLFDLNLQRIVAMTLGLTREGSEDFDLDDEVLIAMLLGPLNSSPYISIPVRNPEIVDKFLDELDKPLTMRSREGPDEEDFFDFVEFDNDFYRVVHPDLPGCRGAAVKIGPVKLRLMWARIGKGLYIATQKEVLEELAALEKQRGKNGDKPRKIDEGPTGHVMVRLRPRNWQKVLSHYQLGWAENNREACLRNLGPLSNVARALRSSGNAGTDAKFVSQSQEKMDRLRGSHAFCPDGGHYHLSADGKTLECSVHGSPAAPRQGFAPNPDSPVGNLLAQIQDVTLNCIMIDGRTHAVLTVDRIPPTAPAKPVAGTVRH